MSDDPAISLPTGLTRDLLDWCRSTLGPCEFVTDHSRLHPGQRASLFRLRTPDGICLLKLHRDRGHWENEVHAYENWVPAFGRFAPQLLGVRAEEPLAVILSELPGRVLEESNLSAAEQLNIWRTAGQALAGLHALGALEFFGPCHRDGSNAGQPVGDARDYLRAEFDGWLERDRQGSFLSPDELHTVREAYELIPAFAGERPVPCHRDYCPANWLVQHGAWSGVIDFEFSYGDVRSADLTRFPAFDWIEAPELLAAFFDGYGRQFSSDETRQIHVSQVLYALTAVVWGCENEYFGYAADGRRALKVLEGPTWR